MPIVRKFIWGHDDEYGIDGWKPAKIPEFNVTSAFGIAHDVLEHFSDSDASIEGEFLAFGAMLYMRAEGDYWANAKQSFNPDPAYQMAGDVAEFMRQKGHELRRPGRTNRLDDDLEGVIARIKDNALKEIKSEEDEEDWNRFSYERYMDNAIGWMRKGYRKAAKRWDINHSYRRVGLFYELEQRLEKVRGGDYGETLVVSINKKNLDVRVHVQYDEYEEY